MHLRCCAILCVLFLSFSLERPDGFRDKASDNTRRSQWEFRLWVLFFCCRGLQTTLSSLHGAVNAFALLSGRNSGRCSVHIGYYLSQNKDFRRCPNSSVKTFWP
uniref:Putative secreted protein n=1 Tax=Ixodes ricinus TaxID=34613 RepID=A0A6B0U7U6_IXORI